MNVLIPLGLLAGFDIVLVGIAHYFVFGPDKREKNEGIGLILLGVVVLCLSIAALTLNR